MSIFYGFNIARSGLFASQRALNVAAHNIANANTEGYTRQRLEVSAAKPIDIGNGKLIGTGVKTGNIVQIRDEYLDFKYRGENTSYGEWLARSEALQTIEAIFNEPSTSGIATVLDQFFSSLHSLNDSPESLTVRALVRQRGIALTNTLNHMAEQLKKLQSDIDFEIKTIVDEINGYANQIVNLNRMIFSTEIGGGIANDLRDQRNLILDKLSQLVNIDYYEDVNGRFHVLINGKSLVSHFDAKQLSYSPRVTQLNEDDAYGLYDVFWADGSTFNPRSGKLKGLLDIRDNISGSGKGIPYYIERLNHFVDVLTDEINKIHSTGYGLDGSTGIYFFTIDGMSSAEFEDYLLNRGLNGGKAIVVTEDIENGLSHEEILEKHGQQGKTIKKLLDGRYIIVDKISANRITISKDIDLDLNKIAASSTKEGIPGDGSNALKMSNIRDNISLYEWGSPDDYIKSLISNLGVDTQEAIRMEKNQFVLVSQVDDKRQSVSGVSLDEEMADMIRFQHSFNANARMITAIDEMIDTVINRLGIVGR